MAPKPVNHPTDVKFKEQDVNNKLQLYGIYSAFAQGKAPSNQQIDIALNSALESSALSQPPKELSADGQGLVADLKSVIEQAKLLLLTKNEGNLLQEFIWETQQISVGGTKLPGAPVDKEAAKQHGNDLLDGLRTLGTLIITNGQFRKLLKDSSILLRDIAGDAASNTAGFVAPSESDLAQIDRPAEDNTWHDAPDTAKLRSQAQGLIPFGKKDAKEAAANAESAAKSEDTATGAAVAGVEAGAKTADGKTDVDVAEQKGKAKSKAQEYNQKTQNYLKGKMPKERREQTLWRLKKMVVEIQGHADYQKAIETLLYLAEQYTGHGRALATDGQGTVKGVQSDKSLQNVETNLKTLLERFANGTSTDDFFDALNQIYKDADQDPELRGWFSKVNGYIRKCLKEQGYIIQDTAQEDYNKLYDQGRHLLRQKYRAHTDRVLDEIKFWGTQFDEDPQNRTFADSVQKLFTDLGQDENGKPTFKPHLWKDITEVILPKVLESVHYVPLPRLEYSDPKVDLIVENLIVESDNLAPNVMEFKSDNYWKWGRKTIKNKNKNKVELAVSGIQMDLRDVSYYVNSKSGFKTVDQGLLDIFLGGDGFSFKIKMETADKSNSTHFFEVTDVKVQVKNFNIKLKQSKHKFLFALIKPILLKVIRPGLQKAIEAAIKQKAREADEFLFQIQKEALQAKKDIEQNPDPENIKSIFQLYWEAANQRWLRAKQEAEKVEAKVEDKKFNMAMTKHDSIFPSIDLPSGISTKATEYKELATKGERWESPVFSVGSAKASSTLPKAPVIVRKHQSKPAAALGSVFGANPGVATSGFNGQNGVKATNGFNGVTNVPIATPATFDPNSVA